MKYKNKEGKPMAPGIPNIRVIKEHEKERAIAEAGKDQNGPVRVYLQGGKKCNIVIP